jgi:diadenosine tetraphosphate (Ap4A) HIT family hydrolase
MSSFYQNKLIRIEVEESEIPWLKIFTQQSYKEMSEVDPQTKQQIWMLLDLIEVEMLDYFKPDKINIASFANYLPQVHWHIMARYKQDSFFPEPMWGKRQRDSDLQIPAMGIFIERLSQTINDADNL